MALSILSKDTESMYETFKSVALSVLKSKLFLIVTENAFISEDRVEVEIKKYFGNNEDDYEYFLMDIISEKEQIKFNQLGLLDFNFKGIKYYRIACTDNTPSIVCYYFSLAYLKLKPSHKIALYDDCLFGLEEIKMIESKTGFTEDWAKKIKK